MLYPAMSTVPPIGFQGKSDAQLRTPYCSELVISLEWVKRGMAIRGVAGTDVKKTRNGI